MLKVLLYKQMSFLLLQAAAYVMKLITETNANILFALGELNQHHFLLSSVT